MARTARTSALKALALVVALSSLTINFGVIDLVDGFTGYVDQARNQVLDVGWGAMFGVILPLGLLAQLRRPERRIAGIQQTAVVAIALAGAGALGAAWRYVALAGGAGFGPPPRCSPRPPAAAARRPGPPPCTTEAAPAPARRGA